MPEHGHVIDGICPGERSRDQRQRFHAGDDAAQADSSNPEKQKPLVDRGF
jgi:hypothetical protein